MLAFIATIREHATFLLQLCTSANTSRGVNVGDYSVILSWLDPERPNAPEPQPQSGYPESAWPSQQQTSSTSAAPSSSPKKLRLLPRPIQRLAA